MTSKTGLPDCVWCGGVVESIRSVRRPVDFAGVIRRYVRCPSCGSRALAPMPLVEELDALYGREYNEDSEAAGECDDPRAVDWVLSRVLARVPNRFVYYGCGSGALLAEVAAAGVEAVGFDFDPDGVEAAASSSGCPVFTFEQATGFRASAAMVHIGDVLEHVPNPGAVLADACRLLQAGGTLLVEGPLEANRSLFNAFLGLSAVVGGRRPTDVSPYHVHLVSASGQRRFFGRAGLLETVFETHDVCWPAPSQCTWPVLRSPRLLMLYLVRRVSTVFQVPRVHSMANRFRYEGVWPG